ncbi:hypothetical protein L7F22_065678 [Adiantum nelumboides]|nr:hypothetical protein [Adiantum nelumboides]
MQVMDTNGRAPSAAGLKPSDAPSALCFVKNFVEDCWGSEFDAGVSQAGREKKPAPESLQVLGQVLYEFGDQLSSDGMAKILYILLDVIKYPISLSTKASVLVQDVGSRTKVVDIETLRLAINALTNLFTHISSTISKDDWLHTVKTCGYIACAGAQAVICSLRGVGSSCREVHTFWELVVGDHLSSGGVCISVGSRWLPRVIDHGTLVAGRAMWISLQCDASIVGILCIYAPTTAVERSWF